MDQDRALRWARRLGLFALARWLTRGRLRILCYHGIWIGPSPHYGDRLFMSAAKFERRMARLVADGYRVLPLDEALQRLASRRLGARDVVITIDDAWQGIEAHMLPVLQRLQLAATLYVPTHSVLSGQPVLGVLCGYLAAQAKVRGALQPLRALLPSGSAAADAELAERLEGWLESLPSWPERLEALRRIARVSGHDADRLIASGAFSLMNPQGLRQAFAHGVDLQLHTHHHSMHAMDPGRVRQEIELNRRMLAELLDTDGARFRHFCYPSGEHDPSIFPALVESQVHTATTTDFGLPGARDPLLALPRILDGESMTDLQFEARMSGLWSLANQARRLLARLAPRRPMVRRDQLPT